MSEAGCEIRTEFLKEITEVDDRNTKNSGLKVIREEHSGMVEEQPQKGRSQKKDCVSNVLELSKTFGKLEADGKKSFGEEEHRHKPQRTGKRFAVNQQENVNCLNDKIVPLKERLFQKLKSADRIMKCEKNQIV